MLPLIVMEMPQPISAVLQLERLIYQVQISHWIMPELSRLGQKQVEQQSLLVELYQRQDWIIFVY
uniref:Uncharacterized protein n=1 Tax=uncultured marine virus TaxID=186617 RepID=A0A0F7L4T4_9VIRU|nr:hypothetical protein [uncultured marine virus]